MKPAKNSTISLSDDKEILSLMILKVYNIIISSRNFVTNCWSKNLLFVKITEYFTIILFDYQCIINLCFIKTVLQKTCHSNYMKRKIQKFMKITWKLENIKI